MILQQQEGGLFKPSPVTKEALENARAKAKEEINSVRDKKLLETIEYKGLVFQADEKSQILLGNAITLYSLAGGVPEGFVWRDEENQDNPFTLDDLIGLGLEIGARTDVIMKKAWSLKAELDGFTTIEEIQGLRWES